MMIGSSIASILTIFFGVHDPAPHGGFLVLPVVDGGLQWVIAILIGAIVGGILFVIFKKVEYGKKQKAAPVVEATPAAAVAAPAEAAASAAEGFVKEENIFLGQDFASRDDTLSFISNEAVKRGIADDADALMQAFLTRESEGTTGMMDGFAIPHAKCEAVKAPSVIVVKDDSGVADWDTMDQAPVNVAIALLIPESQAGTTHLKLLSKVAEALMDEGFRATIKSATEPSQVLDAISSRLA